MTFRRNFFSASPLSSSVHISACHVKVISAKTVNSRRAGFKEWSPTCLKYIQKSVQ